MICKIIALCFIGLMIFILGVIIGMAVEEWIQDEIRERRERWPRSWDKRSKEEE